MDALDWIALVTSHVPDPFEQMIRYYGRYSNVYRGKRGQSDLAISVPSPVDDSPETDSPTERFARQRRRNWARLLKKIYEVDPLTCPRCASHMEVIAFIEEADLIGPILQHLGLWERPRRSPPPRLFPHKLASFLGSLPPQQARRVRASTDSIFWDDVPEFTG